VGTTQLRGQAISRLTLADVIAADKPADFTGAVETLATDLSAPGTAVTLAAKRARAKDTNVHGISLR
jgi:hypothetical protein